MEVHSDIWNPEFTVIPGVLAVLLGANRNQKYSIAGLMPPVLTSNLILREPSNLPFYPFYVVDMDASYSQEH